jgi:hypothetical protein
VGSAVNDAYTNPILGLGVAVSKRIIISENRVEVPSEMFAIGESRYSSDKANPIPEPQVDWIGSKLVLAYSVHHSIRAGTVKNTTNSFAMAISQR